MAVRIKVLLATLCLILVVVFALLGNDTIVASSLVAFLLVLTRIRKPEGTGNDEGNAARRAIFAFAVLVILANLIIPCALPCIASRMDFSTIDIEMTSAGGVADPDGERMHFIEVMTNDMHELCYTTGLLLGIQFCLTLVASRKRIKAPKTGKREKRR